MNANPELKPFTPPSVAEIANKTQQRLLKLTRPGLTQRQLQVMKLVARGLTNAAIGKRLKISIETVRTHIRHALQKLAINSREYLTWYYVRVVMTPAERARWRRNFPLNQILLYSYEAAVLVELCANPDATNGQIGDELLLSGNTIKMYLWELRRRVATVPRQRSGLITLLELNRSEK